VSDQPTPETGRTIEDEPSAVDLEPFFDDLERHYLGDDEMKLSIGNNGGEWIHEDAVSDAVREAQNVLNTAIKQSVAQKDARITELEQHVQDWCGRTAVAELSRIRVEAERDRLLMELRTARGTLEMSHIFTAHRNIGDAIAKSDALDGDSAQGECWEDLTGDDKVRLAKEDPDKFRCLRREYLTGGVSEALDQGAQEQEKKKK